MQTTKKFSEPFGRSNSLQHYKSKAVEIAIMTRFSDLESRLAALPAQGTESPFKQGSVVSLQPF